VLLEIDAGPVRYKRVLEALIKQEQESRYFCKVGKTARLDLRLLPGSAVERGSGKAIKLTTQSAIISDELASKPADIIRSIETGRRRRQTSAALRSRRLMSDVHLGEIDHPGNTR